MPHVVKKSRNTARLTGFENHPRDLMLDGLIMSLPMLYDLWQLSSDSEGRGKEEGDLMLHRKLRKEIFELDASSLLRTPHAMKIFSQSMLSLIDAYKGNNPKAEPGAYTSWIKWITVMDRYIDVMNGTSEKGCENIDSADHNHVYKLLDVVVFHTHWRDQHKKHSQHFLPRTTYQDIVWSAIGIVGVARKQLRDGHTMVQRRSGSDMCEKSFCQKRNKNANANALQTNQIMARNTSSQLWTIAASRKANFGKQKTYFGFELDDAKIKRIKINKRRGKSN